MAYRYETEVKIDLKQIGIITNPESDRAITFAAKLADWCKSRNISCFLHDVHEELDLIVTLGGDGTLLHIAEQASRHSIPVLGVNLGSLGFLTELCEEETFPALERIMNEAVTVENRLMLKSYLINSEQEKNSPVRYGLNEVVINKKTVDRLLSLTARANGQKITNYKSDGLIFSTPTGATAYNLSAGGPLVHPGLSAILVTPICPFMLSSRPLLLPPDCRITTSFSEDCNIEHAKVIIDGQPVWDMNRDNILVLERAENPLRLLSVSPSTYFQVLHNKLHWGGKR